MKLFNQIIIILVVFLKTETVFSENNLFSVNNIQLEKKGKISNNDLSNQAIKKGFNKLIEKILLKEDIEKLSDLDFISVKQLVMYYQVSNTPNKKKKTEVANFSITFDKDKIHKLFYEKGISYSDILDKELYVLPILLSNDEIFVFNNNFFYKNWNDVYNDTLIDFILPLENIEILQTINKNRMNLIDLNIDNLFREYKGKNLALILIENNQNIIKKIYIKTKLQGKLISKSLKFKEDNLDMKESHEKILISLKKELVRLVKSKNLIDIRIPSFLNVKLNLNKKNNLVDLNSRLNNINLITNIFVQDFNKDYMNLRIKYLGKLDKIINQLKKKDIDLQLINDYWVIKKF